VSSTRVGRHVNAPRAVVYRALLDARAVATWTLPTADNESGWCAALEKLAALVEAGGEARSRGPRADSGAGGAHE
jgi:hypothetical protein